MSIPKRSGFITVPRSTLDFLGVDPSDYVLDEDLELLPDIYWDARRAMILASDSVTGMIPEDAEFSSEIRDYIASSSEIQQFREELIAEKRALQEAKWDFVKQTMQPHVDAWEQRRSDASMPTDEKTSAHPE